MRGSSSGHPAAKADIQAIAQQYAAPLNPGSVTVTVTWTPNNGPGNTVQVVVSYSITPSFLPIDRGALTLAGTASQIIVQ